MPKAITLSVNGTPYSVEILEREREKVTFLLEKRQYTVELTVPAQPSTQSTKSNTRSTNKSLETKGPQNSNILADENGLLLIKTPMPGIVVGLDSLLGAKVAAKAILLRIEAMKMQNSVCAPCDCEVIAILVSVGQEIHDHEVLMKVRPL